MQIKIGTLIDGRYRVTAKIGHGGMADIYEATDIIKKVTVAIKMIRDDVMLDSIGWMRCLVAVEKKLGCAIDPKVFFSSCNTSIGALCESLLKYFNII